MIIIIISLYKNKKKMEKKALKFQNKMNKNRKIIYLKKNKIKKK